MNDITALAQREKFEAWAEEVGALPWGRLKKQRNTSGGYSLQVYTYMWKAWQAASKASEQQLAAVVAENAGVKKRTQQLIDIISNADNDYCMCGDAMKAHANGGCGWPTGMFDYHYNKWLESGSETPATDVYLAEVRASAISEYADKRGFSFQHGSIHAHFGNGDVLVGATKFETGHAGICFAPVRDKTGGSGTEYAWTEGKNTEEVGAVFVISSSSVEGLEVIQGKIAEAIAQLRQGAAL